MPAEILILLQKKIRFITESKKLRIGRGHSSGKQQVSLLRYVATLLPKKTPVFLVGDSEFGSIFVLRQLDQWHWFYVLRQKSNTGLWIDEQTSWQEMGSFVHQAGQSAWFQNVYLTQKEIYRVSVLIYWQIGFDGNVCSLFNMVTRGNDQRHGQRCGVIPDIRHRLSKSSKSGVGQDLAHLPLQYRLCERGKF